MDSLASLCESIGEVNALADLAQINIYDEVRYAALNKSAILLLCSKFETFVETISEEYVFEVQKLSLGCEHLPIELRVVSAKQALKDIEKIEDFEKYKAKAPATFQYISSLWCGCRTPEKIQLSFRFDYGAHGEKALKKLFTSMGFVDVFSECQISIPRDSLTEECEEELISAQAIINSITNYRNNIIHSDGDPNLTHDQIRGYVVKIVGFAKGIDKLIQTKIQSLAAAKQDALLNVYSAW